MANNSGSATIHNLDEHFPHMGALDLGYGELDVAQIFQDCFLFHTLSEAGLKAEMLDKPSEIIEAELQLVTVAYEKLLKIQTLIGLREKYKELIAQRIMKWKTKMGYYNEVLDTYSHNTVITKFFLSKKQVLASAIERRETPLKLDDKAVEILTGLENNLPYLQKISDEMKEHTVFPFPLYERITTVLTKVDTVRNELGSLGEGYINQRFNDTEILLDGGLMPYSDTVQYSTSRMDEGTQALNQLMGWNNGSPAIKALAGQQVNLLSHPDDDENIQWKELQEGYTNLLLAISSIKQLPQSTYEPIETIEDLMSAGVNQLMPAEWLQHECERHLLANYDAAVDLLGQEVPILAPAERVSRLVGKLSGKESKKSDLLIDLKRISGKHTELSSMIAMYNALLNKGDITTDDMVQLCQFDLLSDDVLLGSIEKNVLPTNVNEYVTINV